MSRERAKINEDEDEVVIGPLTFEWDPKSGTRNGGGIQISVNGEVQAYIDGILTSEWEDFVYATFTAAEET